MSIVKCFFFPVNIINNMCNKNPFVKVFGTKLDCFLLHSTHLSLTNLVSVYHNLSTSLCKSVVISLEPVFLNMFNDSTTCDMEGSEFEIKDSMSSQIFKTLVTLTWDNFTVPLSSHGKLGRTINAIILKKLL